MEACKDPIQQLCDALLEQAQARKFKAPQLRFRPSELGGCWREIYYRLAGNEPKPKDADALLMFMDGDVHHDAIRQMMQKAGVGLQDIVISEDGSVEETGSARRVFKHEFGGRTWDVEISGRTDGRIDTPRGNCIHEIKTIAGFKHLDMQRAFTKGGQARLKALLDEKKYRRITYQFQATLMLTGADLMYVTFKDRDMGKIGLKDKDGNRVGFYVEADPVVQQDILDRCCVVLEALELRKPPSTEFMDGTTSCNFCAFHHLCWGALKK